MGIFDRVGNRTFSPLNGPISAGGGSSSPLTTKGDVWGYSTLDARVPIGTNGQVLTADSTQALGLKWANVSATPAGSAGQVQFYSSGALGADSNFVWDNSAKRLGIGTNAPALAFHVKLSSSGQIAEFEDGTNGFLIQTGANYGGMVGYTQANGYNNLDIRGSASTQLWLDTNGNVGVGNQAPSAKLHATGTVRFDSFGAGVSVFDASGNVSSTALTTGYIPFGSGGALGADAKLSWNNTSKHLFVGTPTYDRGALNIYIADPPGGGIYWSMLTGAEFGWDTVLSTTTGEYELHGVESGVDVGTWFAIARGNGVVRLPHYGAGVATFNASGVISSVAPTTVTAWVSFTPTGTFTANVTYTGKWRRVGDTMEVQTAIAFSGAPNAATDLIIDVPAGFSIDTAKLASSANYTQSLGTAHFQNDGVLGYPGEVVMGASNTTVLPYAPGTGNATDTLPFAFNTGDTMSINYKFPVTGWTVNN